MTVAWHEVPGTARLDPLKSENYLAYGRDIGLAESG
jgi:hypothetical protein